jgi:hypothetical protein
MTMIGIRRIQAETFKHTANSLISGAFLYDRGQGMAGGALLGFVDGRSGLQRSL